MPYPRVLHGIGGLAALVTGARGGLPSRTSERPTARCPCFRAGAVLQLLGKGLGVRGARACDCAVWPLCLPFAM